MEFLKVTLEAICTIDIRYLKYNFQHFAMFIKNALGIYFIAVMSFFNSLTNICISRLIELSRKDQHNKYILSLIGIDCFRLVKPIIYICI